MPNENNRILLPTVPILEFVKQQEGPEKIILTRKHIPFLFEEFISQGVNELVVWDKQDVDFDVFPTIIQKHITTSKSSGRSGNQIMEIFKPVFEEFGIQIPDALGFHYTRDEHRPPECDLAMQTAIDACTKLQSYLNALHEKSLCQFDIASMLTELEHLDRACRTPEARANISVLRGIFSGYKTVSHAAINCQINSSDAMVELFEELLENAHYQSLSHEAKKFGTVQKLNTVKRNVSKLVKAVIQSRRGKSILDYGSRVITVATGVPVPTTELAESLIKNAYFPPVVDMSQGIERATKKLIENLPDTRFVPINFSLSK